MASSPPSDSATLPPDDALPGMTGTGAAASAWPPRDPLRRHPLVRASLLGLGWLCVVLALIGAILPVMPTTIFLLIAGWAFARSSTRFHGWLHDSRVFGPYLRDWESHGVVPRQAKLGTVAMMALAVAILAALGVATWLVLLVGAVLLPVATFVVTRPSTRAEAGARPA